MRGIVLAGGTGSRLGASSYVVNKHVLPVGGVPMIHWPLGVMRDHRIEDVTIVSTPRGIGQIAELLGGGYTYRVQDRPGGIAQAIAAAGGSRHQPVLVILGDNVFLPTPMQIPSMIMPGHAMVFLKDVPAGRVREFGNPVFTEDPVWRVSHIVEKPKVPANNYAVTGVYLFGSDVFDRAAGLSESDRGEMEITDLLNTYAADKNLHHRFLPADSFWGDAGTPVGLLECSQKIARLTGELT